MPLWDFFISFTSDERAKVMVARLQNLIPSFPWIVPGWRAWGIKFCHLATLSPNLCPALYACSALTSSALGSLEPPGLCGVPVDAVVRQLGGDEGPDDGAPPVVPQHLQHVLPPTEVVRRPLRVVLVRRLAVQDCRRIK